MAASGTSAVARLRTWCSRGIFGRGRHVGSLARVWSTFLAALVVGAMLPMTVSAQVFASNGGIDADNPGEFAGNEAGSGDFTVLVQPFTVPEGGGSVNLQGVALWLTGTRWSAGTDERHSQRLYLVASSSETQETFLCSALNDDADAQTRKEHCAYALPDAEVSLPSTGAQYWSVVQENSTVLAEFVHSGSTSISGKTRPTWRHEFWIADDGMVTLTENTTYHVYLFPGQPTESPSNWYEVMHHGIATNDPSGIDTCPDSTAWIYEQWQRGDYHESFEVLLPGNARRLQMDLVGERNHRPTGLAIADANLSQDGRLVAATSTLSAVTSGIADENGVPSSATYTYQWMTWDADGNDPQDIAGATGASYTVTQADVDAVTGGRQIGVEAGFEDLDCYDADWLIPNVARAMFDNPPVGDPVISGNPEVGATLEVSTTGISDADGPDPLVFTYQWQRTDMTGANPEDITGATSDRYILTSSDDANVKIRVRVSYSDSNNNSYTLDSALTDYVNAPATGAPEIIGTTTVDQTLSVRVDSSDIPTGIDDPNGLPTTPTDYTYRWVRVSDGSTIGQGREYTLVDDDAGDQVEVVVDFMDGRGNPETTRSVQTLPINQADNTPADGSVTIAGDNNVGQTLTATLAGIADPVDSLPSSVLYTYQWRRSELDSNGVCTGARRSINGASSSTSALMDTYTLTSDDMGKGVDVVVTFMDNRGNTETKMSPRCLAINTKATGVVNIEARLGYAVGRPLTADTSGIVDPDGLPTEIGYMYQWQTADASCGNQNDITGAIGKAYTPVAGDEGKKVLVVVSFIDGRMNPEELSSDCTDSIGPEITDIAATGEPSIEGSPRVGRELEADTDDIVDQDVIDSTSWRYQWIRRDVDGSNEIDIPGATLKTYTTVPNDFGKVLFVEVEFADTFGNQSMARSAPFGPIMSRLQANVLKNILSGFSHSLSNTFVDIIWQRASSHRAAGSETFASLGGRSLDASALSSNNPNRTAAEIAKFFGIEVVPTARAAYGGSNNSHSADGGSGVRAYRSWAGLPDSGNFAKRTSFALALDGSADGGGSPVLWGRGDTRTFKNGAALGSGSGFSLSARDAGASVGIDRSVDNSIIGLVVVKSERDTDYAYEELSLGQGDATASIMSVAPWFHWTDPVGFEVWATFGRGVGVAKINNESGDRVKVDIGHQVLAGGFRGIAQIFEGMNSAVKADAFLSSSSSEKAVHLAGVRSEASRLRMAIEASTRQPFGKRGGLANYIFEIGLRFDGGEAVSGTGMDFLTEFRYASPSGGLMVHGQGSLLVQHSHDDFETWGLAGGVEWDPGPSDRGLQLSLQPTWNSQITEVADTIRDTDANTGNLSGSNAALVAWLGYGAGVLQERALATAYGEMESASEANRLRLGAELRQQRTVVGRVTFDLYGEQRNSLSGSESAIMLESSLGF